MEDAELFMDNFGDWLEQHGVTIGNWNKDVKKFEAEIDLNILKAAIYTVSKDLVDTL